MREPFAVALSLVVVAMSHVGPPATSPPQLERIRADDNLRSAGTLRDGVLTLRLDARVGMWYPDGDDAPGAPMQAFAEVGRDAQIPGPLIRVPAGTEIVVTVTNSVREGALAVHGLVSRPVRGGAAAESLIVAPGETREARFRLDAPGTYYYWGTTTGRDFFYRTREDAQLSGAIVVDEPGAAPPRDRVLVIGMWADTAGTEDTRGRGEHGRLLFVVNGRSWPHTERLSYVVGDTVRWRVVNTSADVHPMHLHGFYYRIDARGDALVDTVFAEDRRDLAVTDVLRPGRTMRIAWVPERPGNWLFHCHTTAHFSPRGPLGMPRAHPPATADGARALHAGDHARDGMNGLVVGIVVAPRNGAPVAAESAPDPERRRLRLIARPSRGGTDERPLYSFALLEGGAEPPPDSGVRPGPPIVLERGVPVGITVINRTPEPTIVHWHGIELESYFDGVPGFSGSGTRLSPPIAPADSFEARFTPPRSGTFIYHTHFDEKRQQPAGLAGVIVVVDPGAPWDPSRDTPVLVTTPPDPADESRAVLVNGSMSPAALDIRAGVPHRLRLVNITTARPNLFAELRRDSALVTWRVLAKDGADLPPARMAARPARLRIGIGETSDVEILHDAPGELRLELRTLSGRVVGTLPIRVRPPG